ncbi:hypothetical protein [Christiangramia sp. LLG6405-1]|uniref:hypothetical protein n=1 Tax=Christiangramia sp. LLG6405-1 TaxID=3160832 RepID=UPI0038644457
MQYRTLTVKMSSIMDRETEYKEFQFPKLNELLEAGWGIKEIIPATTNQNVGFVFLTYILCQQ